jgi:hypothetical protein
MAFISCKLQSKETFKQKILDLKVVFTKHNCLVFLGFEEQSKQKEKF